MNTIKMNKQIKTKKTITCSTCGKTGHSKNNEKFHPDYKFTGVSVPTPVKVEPSPVKSRCYRCDTSTKELFLGVDIETGFKTSYCRGCKEAVEIHNIDFNPDNWIGFTIPCDLCKLPHYVNTTVCRSVNGNFCDNIGCYYTQKHEETLLRQKAEMDALNARHALENSEDDQDLIIIKGGAPEPIPIVKIQPGVEETPIEKPILRDSKYDAVIAEINAGVCSFDNAIRINKSLFRVYKYKNKDGGLLERVKHRSGCCPHQEHKRFDYTDPYLVGNIFGETKLRITADGQIEYDRTYFKGKDKQNHFATRHDYRPESGFSVTPRGGVEILGMRGGHLTKDGKYKYEGVSIVDLKEACKKNGIKGFSGKDKHELVKLLMKV